MAYILSLDFDEGWDMFLYAIQQDNEDKIFSRWLHYQTIPYDEFKGSLQQGNISVDPKSQEEILMHVKDIVNNFTLYERG